VYFGDSKKSSEGNSTYSAPNDYQGSENPYIETEALINKYQQQGVQSDFAMLEDDDSELPF
jgi:2',3'-cyclic-nucleotide 2'-phosphodiesterase (5'-nucleotidase family)